MKKNNLRNIIFLVALIIVFCISVVIIKAKKTKPEGFSTADYGDVETIQEFNISSIEKYISLFSINDLNIGPISSIDEAREAAIKVWSSFPNVGNYSGDRPLKVHYDSESDVWFICEAVPIGAFGGGLKVVITSSGDVLAVWSDA